MCWVSIEHRLDLHIVSLLNPSCDCRYIKKLRQHLDVFPDESLMLIFNNIEEILGFQLRFLEALRHGVENQRIAEAFLDHVSGLSSLNSDHASDPFLCFLSSIQQSDFTIYSTYCNAYPRALMELDNYTGNASATALFER